MGREKGCDMNGLPVAERASNHLTQMVSQHLNYAANRAKIIEDSGAALCALADILDAVDEERFKGAYGHAGIGYLLKIMGVATLQDAHSLREYIAEAGGPAVDE